MERLSPLRAERPRRRFERSPVTQALREAAFERGGLAESGASAAVLRRDTLYRRSLAVADVVAASFALVVATLAGGDRLQPGIVLILPLVVLIGKAAGTYDHDEARIRKSTLDDGPALFHAATLFSLLVWLADGLVVYGTLERPQVLGIWILLFVSMLLARATARRLVSRLAPPERCLLLGHRAAADRVRAKFEASTQVKAEMVGVLPLIEEGSTTVAGVRRISRAIRELEVDRVIIAPSGSDPNMLDAIRLVKSLGVKVSVLPRLFEVVGSSVKFDDVDGLVLLGVPQYGLTTSSTVLKRAVDIAGAAVGLALLSPLFLLVAIAIKLDTRGPVLFRQSRIGRGGKDFEMLKLRTMVEGADSLKAELQALNESDGFFKIADDPRITRVGRLLRRLSLDELPQLVNVLRGEMSLVGPRPLVPDEDSQVEGWQRRRLIVTPGMTGVWQILGSSRVPMQEMVKIDYLYTGNWSLWLDVKILMRTALYIGHRRGL